MAYGGERADLRALDHLEVVVRELAEEMAGWRARALKAEADLKGGGRSAGRGGIDPEARAAQAELEAENRVLRHRVEAARQRVEDLLARLAFLEEQSRATSGGTAGGTR